MPLSKIFSASTSNAIFGRKKKESTPTPFNPTRKRLPAPRAQDLRELRLRVLIALYLVLSNENKSRCRSIKVHWMHRIPRNFMPLSSFFLFGKWKERERQNLRAVDAWMHFCIKINQLFSIPYLKIDIRKSSSAAYAYPIKMKISLYYCQEMARPTIMKIIFFQEGWVWSDVMNVFFLQGVPQLVPQLWLPISLAYIDGF